MCQNKAFYYLVRHNNRTWMRRYKTPVDFKDQIRVQFIEEKFAKLIINEFKMNFVKVRTGLFDYTLETLEEKF